MAASARKDKPKKSPAKAKPVKKERPAHWKEGQKHELNPPLETEPLYVFYTSLRRQRPASEMAETWMLEHGLLENRELDAALKKRNLGKAKRTTAVKREVGTGEDSPTPTLPHHSASDLSPAPGPVKTKLKIKGHRLATSGRAKTESPAKRAIKPKITIKKPAAASTPEKKPAPKAVKVKAIVESDTDDDDVPIGVMLKRTGEA
mmetsp:Transcript_2029/g.7262  ORF Transcript_2029/g.7262 Transcript_2029/m.7262 type:complete len:204 (-) Transcript_2029:152-763(-)